MRDTPDGQQDARLQQHSEGGGAELVGRVCRCWVMPSAACSLSET
jgi:hypothetical protein